MDSAAATLRAHSEFRPTAESRPKPVLRDINRRQTLCSTCKLRDLCLSEGLDIETMRQIDALVTTRLSLRKGTTLYRVGTRFTSLYAIRSGSCKTVVLSADGQSQVAGYHMAGDIIGSGGIGTGVHGCEAICSRIPRYARCRSSKSKTFRGATAGSSATSTACFRARSHASATS